MSNPEARPRAAIFGCAGQQLLESERRFFSEADPLGFILFERNCKNPDQVIALVKSLRESVGRPSAPVLIYQEGGRVARLKPPHWRTLPPAGMIGKLGQRDIEAGREAAFAAARLIAADLAPLGIDVDCAPVLYVPVRGSHGIIGDRAFADEPTLVADLGRAFCRGLLAGGVLPVIKHIPGHGRARVDSHAALPTVEAHRPTLENLDFAPFHALRDMPMAMTAHVVYRAFDARLPATTSKRIIADIIRGKIGFDGLLMSDDLSMGALHGSLAERTQAALDAGCDVALHCNGKMAEMEAVASKAGPMTDAAMIRFERAQAMRQPPQPVETGALAARLETLIATASAA